MRYEAKKRKSKKLAKDYEMFESNALNAPDIYHILWTPKSV
jgi:hypothetical protein